MQVLKRGQAAGMGHKEYYTGRPCINGHDSPRYVSTGHCKACQKAAQQVYQSRILRRDIRVIVPVPRELAFDDEDTLHADVYAYGVNRAAELAALRPMDIRTGKLVDVAALQREALAQPEPETHPGGFRAPRVRNPDKPYLSVQTVTYPAPPPRAAPLPPVADVRLPEVCYAPPPPPPPMPPVTTARTPEPADAGYVDDIEPTADELLAEFERMSR